jgi:hypothetical protein
MHRITTDGNLKEPEHDMTKEKPSLSDLLTLHKMPCGPMTIRANAVCRFKLSEDHARILDRISSLSTPEAIKKEAPKGHTFGDDGKLVPDNVDQTPEAKGMKMFEEGIVKNEVKAKLKEHATALEPEKEPEPTLEERKKEMLNEAKAKVEVKVKAREHEKRLMGNSKMLQDPTGKIEKR